MHDRPQRRLAAGLVATAIATAACAGSDRTAPAPPPTAEAASTSTLASATTEVRTTAGLPEPTAATEIDWQGIAADSAEAFVREMGDGGPRRHPAGWANSPRRRRGAT